MLQFERSRQNGGFTLWGDFESLKSLHAFAMDISEKSPVLNSVGLVPALAYDLRKAFEGRRESEKAKNGDDEITIYGVEQVWPTFILQVALLRTGLAFIVSSKHEQSQMFRLEGFLEDAVNHIFPKESRHILHCYNGLIGTHEKFVAELVGSRVSYFLFLNARERKAQLAELLCSLNWMWEHTHGILDGEGKVVLTPEHFVRHGWETIDDCDL